MKKELTHVVNLVIGDPSHDGHNQSDTITILSNLPRKAVENAYKNGAKKIGINIVEDLAEGYEEDTISKEQLEKFTSKGFKIELLEGDRQMLEDDGVVSLYAELWADLYLFTAKTGDPEFMYEKTDDNNIDIGGYGIYQ
jgi:hypothetical protein